MVLEQLQIVLNKQNEIFEIRIFSYLLNFFFFYLIFFILREYAPWKISPPHHNNPQEKS